MLRLVNRRGFALPLAILIIAVLTAAISASFSSTASEIEANSAARGQNRAFNIAQAGLEQFMVRRATSGFCSHCAADPATADSEWTQVSLTGGYADVVAVRIRPVVGSKNALFFIRSRGRDTLVKLSGAGRTTYAEHTVGVYAQWISTTINVKAAWVSLGGLVKDGTGVIDGNDQCGASAAVAGVQVNKGDLTIKGGSVQPSGNPAVD